MTITRTARRVMKARRESICPVCFEPIHVGQQIAQRGTWQHVSHIVDDMRQAAAQATEPAETAGQ